jgi:hypothetical protein
MNNVCNQLERHEQRLAALERRVETHTHQIPAISYRNGLASTLPASALPKPEPERQATHGTIDCTPHGSQRRADTYDQAWRDVGRPDKPAPSGGVSAEQQARDMLDQMGVPDAQNYSTGTGNLIELGNLIADNARLRAELAEAKRERDVICEHVNGTIGNQLVAKDVQIAQLQAEVAALRKFHACWEKNDCGYVFRKESYTAEAVHDKWIAALDGGAV